MHRKLGRAPPSHNIYDIETYTYTYTTLHNAIVVDVERICVAMRRRRVRAAVVVAAKQSGVVVVVVVTVRHTPRECLEGGNKSICSSTACPIHSCKHW